MNKIKKIIERIEIEDIKSDGKFSSALISFICLLAIGCFILVFLIFGK